jgi:hypothetical protein
MYTGQADSRNYLQNEITGLVSNLEQEYRVVYFEKRFRESADLYREMRSLSLELDALVSSGMIGFGDFARIIHEGYIVPAEVQIESLKSWIKNCSNAPAGKKSRQMNTGSW